MLLFFNDTATTEIYTLSLHDALPISRRAVQEGPYAGNRLGQDDAHPPVQVAEGLQVPFVYRHHRYHTLRIHLHELDRKSTRLNSSHANISYAVFCLEKKNHTSTSLSR